MAFAHSRYIAEYVHALAKTRSIAALQSAPMRKACLNKEMVRVLTNAATARTDVKLIETITETSGSGKEVPTLADGEATLWVTNSQAIWLTGTQKGTRQNSEELEGLEPFLLRFSVSSTVQAAKARQQLREWGFKPRTISKQLFKISGKQQKS